MLSPMFSIQIQGGKLKHQNNAMLAPCFLDSTEQLMREEEWVMQRAQEFESTSLEFNSYSIIY